MAVQRVATLAGNTIQPNSTFLTKVGIMASIYKRKNENSTAVWRAVVRIKGYPTVCNHFERKQEADDWASDIERQIKAGQFKLDQHKQQHTFTELVDRYIGDGALQHHRSAEDTLCHLNYWKERLGAYA